MADSVTDSTTESMPRVLGRPAELMLVEDNYGDILLTQEAFRACKIANRLHIARDGEEALKMLRKEAPYGDLVTPDLILLDLNLPRKDGREVLAEIKSTRELATIPVVILTGSRAELDVVCSYELNANCYIAKPINFEQLQHVVNSIQDFWFSVVLLPSQRSRELAS
jgi:two-component system, chemotaxis family, response regulator Rcp1